MKYKTLLMACIVISAILPISQANAEKIVLAGGCFWCVESDFEKLEGVTSAVSGFTGGDSTNPRYNGNHKGHYEAVEITYDPEVVSYKELLDYFWLSIDPFDPQGQFCDKGPSYRTAIFVANDEERKAAEASKKAVAEQFPNETVATVILDAKTFHPLTGSESYHQDYAKNNPIRYKSYRWGCGRDKRTREIWGEKAIH
ncbi:peptide-methionine (S)-S-oxide reductase MsrA [Alteromonas sp. 5E99-2]|uniref:peptide-methionine (S)-S-oxide reductase MsrA n=1 Tax=Alteromonas sp. 5E99-2 TaxID=2817683 RepID=UPI001A98FE2B|nr:peptide-methionine (S)-S-oxide reductase MsrA [Alteromonas sp. 5E99-2]MBO1254735.1 peptide-methionine (S)-S-oxide reductase MsrA [Alteromonas sp. 5E99-2]